MVALAAAANGIHKTPTSTFEDYNSIMRRVKAQVKSKMLKTEPLPHPINALVSASQSSSHADSQHRPSLSSDSSSDSDTSDLADDHDDLDWEIDNSYSFAEAVVEFRQDLLSPIPPHASSLALTPPAVVLESAVEENADSVGLSSIQEKVSLSSKPLEEQFHHVLKGASILVDYQEKYILKHLAARRELALDAHSVSKDAATVMMEDIHDPIDEKQT
ncbi:hypothetical protein BASA50_006617 [Batrachochytrium salamandrivorans]|uniref:Uncharacterized protein n=1 Tax=Batrachochytrium salamandrivorans TaxID=1357716 RepID=A0ABQ8FC44_9FUNG|nr:hypothetical protein BASA50_006617 [Batrachochytrium salamandrivorans]